MALLSYAAPACLALQACSCSTVTHCSCSTAVLLLHCSTVPLLAPDSSRLGSSVLQCSSTLAHNPLQFETLQCMLPCFALNTAPTYKYNTWLVFAPGTASGGQGTCLGRKAPLGHHWGGRHHLGPENISSCLPLSPSLPS